MISSADEELIIVDENDNIIGYQKKDLCHKGEGILHRAFSVFIFNSKNELLIQKRSRYKHLWPLFWSNTCCGHPRKGEEYIEAVRRRLKEELGMEVEVKYLFKFKYQATYKNIGSENELCSVYIGKSDVIPEINKMEVEDWKYISIEQLNKEFKKHPDRYTPWFKIEWEYITEKFMDEIQNLGIKF